MLTSTRHITLSKVLQTVEKSKAKAAEDKSNPKPTETKKKPLKLQFTNTHQNADKKPITFKRVFKFSAATKKSNTATIVKPIRTRAAKEEAITNNKENENDNPALLNETFEMASNSPISVLDESGKKFKDLLRNQLLNLLFIGLNPIESTPERRPEEENLLEEAAAVIEEPVVPNPPAVDDIFVSSPSLANQLIKPGNN